LQLHPADSEGPVVLLRLRSEAILKPLVLWPLFEFGSETMNLPPGEAHTGITTVIGTIARKDNVVDQFIENTNAETPSRFVEGTVDDKVTFVATDERQPVYRFEAIPTRWRMLE
jgi:hypothetical protein